MDGTETWSPEQLSYFERIYNDQWAGQTQRRQQFMLMRPGMKVTQLKALEEAYKSDYDAWLVMQMGAKFGIPQTMLGIQMHSSIGGGAAGKQQSDQSEQFATDALRNFLVDCINDMARRYMGVGPELTITATGGGNDDDDLTRAQADQIDVSSGIRTRNEIRAERGVPLMSEPEADQLAITTGTGVSFLAGQLDAQQAAMEQAKNPPPPTPKMITTAPDGTRTEVHGAVPPGAEHIAGTSGSVSSTSASVGTAASVGTSASVAAKPKSGAATPDVEEKDDNRQPDTDAEKELATFGKWAKSHMGKQCRPFEFAHQSEFRSKQLNFAVHSGNADLLKSVIGILKSTTVNAAGIVVKADDTGRVLMVQRTVDNDTAPGDWEWPGGILKNGEDPLEAAKREWAEEIGVDLPKGKVVGSWTSSNGYQGFVYVIKHESDLELDNARSSLDGSGDNEIENVAWWDPGDAQSNPAVRTEVASSDWALIGSAEKSARIDSKVPVVPSNAPRIPTQDELHRHYALGWRLKKKLKPPEDDPHARAGWRQGEKLRVK